MALELVTYQTSYSEFVLSTLLFIVVLLQNDHYHCHYSFLNVIVSQEVRVGNVTLN